MAEPLSRGPSKQAASQAEAPSAADTSHPLCPGKAHSPGAPGGSWGTPVSGRVPSLLDMRMQEFWLRASRQPGSPLDEEGRLSCRSWLPRPQPRLPLLCRAASLPLSASSLLLRDGPGDVPSGPFSKVPSWQPRLSAAGLHGLATLTLRCPWTIFSVEDS